MDEEQDGEKPGVWVFVIDTTGVQWRTLQIDHKTR